MPYTDAPHRPRALPDGSGHGPLHLSIRFRITEQEERMILAGDIGGTKTNLALFAYETGPHYPHIEATFVSRRYSSLEAIVREFLAAHPANIEGAAFGVAGPVVGGRATITNLPWVIDVETMRAELSVARVTLLNDLEAIANAVPILEADDVAVLNMGAAVQGGAMAVIAPGTGLGEAFLTWDGSRYEAHPSEGGHASFAPTSATELAMLSYLMARHGHVSFERVCSGIGIPNVYGYFRDEVHNGGNPAIAAQIAAASDATPIIVTAALDPAQPCPACTATLEQFVRILGAEAGNLALKVLATGGVYIGGGIPPRILSALRSPSFLAAFCNKGRFGDLLIQMPINVILNPKTALFGAASAVIR
jgi:glucokinase